MIRICPDGHITGYKHCPHHSGEVKTQPMANRPEDRARLNAEVRSCVAPPIVAPVPTIRVRRFVRYYRTLRRFVSDWSKRAEVWPAPKKPKEEKIA